MNECTHHFEIVGTITYGHSGDPQYIQKCAYCGEEHYSFTRTANNGIRSRVRIVPLHELEEEHA